MNHIKFYDLSVTALLCDCLWRTAFFGTMNLDEDADISDEEIRKILAEADTGGTGGPPLPVRPRPPKQPPPAHLIKERDAMMQKEKAEMASGEETAKLSGPQGRKKNLTQLQSRLCAAWQ